MFAAAPNSRDLGGIETADGCVVRGRTLYRTERLSALSEEDARVLGSLGIHLACDLRTESERRLDVSRWPREHRPEILTLETGGDVRALEPGHLAAVVGDRSGHAASEFMIRTYRAMPAVFGAGLRQLLDRIVDGEQLPLLIHCTAGKDRTGFVVSLLLLALGATREQVRREYMRSDCFFGPDRIREVIGTVVGTNVPERVAEAFRCRPEYLEAVLTEIDGSYGSADAYLLREGGLDGDRRNRLRQLLLEAAPRPSEMPTSRPDMLSNSC